MARNGSGVYSLFTPGNPVVTNTTIDSSAFNSTMNDIASSMTLSLSSDGQTPVVGNFNWAGYSITNFLTTTAAQLDNTTKPATTAFVQRALGNFRGFGTAITGAISLVAADGGNCFKVTGTGYTVTLPAVGTISAGWAVTLINANLATAVGSSYTIATNAAAVILNFEGALASSMKSWWGDSITFVYDGANWQTTGVIGCSGAYTPTLTPPAAGTFTLTRASFCRVGRFVTLQLFASTYDPAAAGLDFGTMTLPVGMPSVNNTGYGGAVTVVDSSAAAGSRSWSGYTKGASTTTASVYVAAETANGGECRASYTYLAD